MDRVKKSKSKILNNTKHSSNKLTPMQAPLQKERKKCLRKFIGQKKENKTNLFFRDLARTADKRDVFS